MRFKSFKGSAMHSGSDIESLLGLEFTVGCVCDMYQKGGQTQSTGNSKTTAYFASSKSQSEL